MSTWQRDGRVARVRLVANLGSGPDGLELRAPAVGLWRGAPPPGARVAAGSSIGELEVLGVLHELFAPAQCDGLVLADGGSHVGERAVGFGDVLLRLGAMVGGSDAAQQAAGGAGTAAGSGDALQFCAPLSGRFYVRSGPDKPPFVKVGDEIEIGHTVALLEVMKTFNRITYGGAGLPERARVVALLAKDEDDVEAGAPLLELQPC
ncbi:MAG: biotin/lipoyl-containing protein [Nannocystaceae bacterium]